MMKNLLQTFFYLGFLVMLTSCQQKEASPAPDNHVPSFSKSYKAPVFEKDHRIEKIKKIAPELHQLITDHARARHIPGIAYGIVVDNELVIASGTGFIDLDTELPATSTSSFRIASMTKSFTAMAILKLRDEAKLSLNDPVSRYIPEMSQLEYLTADSPTITIENLLTMTAGLPEDNPWGDRQLDESDQMLIDLVAEGLSFSNPVSYQFEYSNTNYALLGHIISKVSGIPFQQYIKQNILEPLGMEQTYWEYDSVPKEQLVKGYRWEDDQWKPEPILHDGSFGSMGGLITSIEDFSKYVSFQLSAWPPRNEQDTGPVKRASLREMQTPKFSDVNANAIDFKGDTCAAISGYGYGLGIAKYCNGLKRVGHGGALPGFGSNYAFFPEYGVGIMAFCNLTYTTPYPYQYIGKLLFETVKLEARKLPVSDILRERKEQVTQLIRQWDPELETKILGENFYLDQSRDRRIKDAQEKLEKAGKIDSIGEMDAYNQLRGTYEIHAENGVIEVYFDLTPEKYPKVQSVDLELKLNKTK